jgi:hypothetical protein
MCVKRLTRSSLPVCLIRQRRQTARWTNLRKIITVARVLVIAVIAITAAYTGGPGTGGCRWPTNPNGPCILDELPSQPA